MTEVGSFARAVAVRRARLVCVVDLTAIAARHAPLHDLLVRVPKPASVVTGEDVAERNPAIGDVLQESPRDPQEGWVGLVAAERG